MKTKIIAIVAVFLVLAIGAVLVNAASTETSTTTFASAANGYTVMAGSCNYFCAACVSLGHNGACTSGRACC